jgi:hypothetical protein
METGITTSSTAPHAAATVAPSRGAASSTAPKAATQGDRVDLSPEALVLIAKLKARDTEVRQHEQAHLSAAGGLAVSGASFVYQRGPNGVNYAIGGEVSIDTSPGRTPQETIARARTIVAAALAPAEPSGADLAVAARAQQLALQAQSELAQEQVAAAIKKPDQAPRPTPPEATVRHAYGLVEPASSVIITQA